MTTLAMIFGMVPLAFSLGEGAEQRAPMGQTVIGGIITSSILTLVVVPVIYTYLDDFGAWLGRLWRGKEAAPARAAAPQARRCARARAGECGMRQRRPMHPESRGPGKTAACRPHPGPRAWATVLTKS
ncbi:efflux RND transporter permease subunit [Cupriavidus basilensis]